MAFRVCESDDGDFLPGPIEDLRHLGCAGHTPRPAGYVSWHHWADAMSKTHVQVRCPECGELKICVPKGGVR